MAAFAAPCGYCVGAAWLLLAVHVVTNARWVNQKPSF
jgi:hypothetical protein